MSDEEKMKTNQEERAEDRIESSDLLAKTDCPYCGGYGYLVVPSSLDPNVPEQEMCEPCFGSGLKKDISF